jgi:hypothetical protein
VHATLEVRGPVVDVGERHGEQETEQNLHTGLRHPQFLQQLNGVAVEPLVLGLRHGYLTPLKLTLIAYTDVVAVMNR